MTPANQTGQFAELVCSKSLRSNDILNAVGLLKKEMQSFNSLIMEAAYHAQVPAGSSLAVDRDMFSSYIEDKIKNHKNIEVIYDEVKDIEVDEYTIIAARPLASDDLFQAFPNLFDQKHLHFFITNFMIH